MRIAYLSCVFPPYPGGIGVAAQGMASELARRGHEVAILTPKLSFVGRDKAKLYRVDYIKPLMHFGNAAFLPQVLWRLRDFEIIHLFYPFYGVAELTPLLRRTTRAKIVVHHMMDAVAPGLLGRMFAWHAKHIAPRIFRAADQVLVLSEDYARNAEVVKFGVSWEVVPLGVDVDQFRPNIRRLDLRNTEIQSPPIALFVGGLDRAHYFKGVPVLLKACRILRDRGVKFQCQIVGDGDLRDTYEQNVAQTLRSDVKAKALSYVSWVEFIGLVPHDKLPAYYQRATVCVVPSTERVECFSIVAAEAQACGVPVLVTDFPGVRVTIEHGKTGFVIPPRNAEALAERIQWILEHPAEARAMGQAGQARAEQLYSWKVVGDKLEKVYESR